ncbi:MSP2 family outer membrane protein [Anaplasma phagocytophilum str. CRT38]|uniref:MSP2 family outer membrane protein n=2 Tax=Anaplasma phagocytophilum TaxID=948 RepID=S6G8Q5_ANAPH|nr:MSP2 family outer membrane protein [Anaplasma phagocytophilum str. CRT38]
MRSLGHSVLFWSLGCVIMPMLVLMASCDAMARQGGYFYVGLDYSPTFVNIKNFSIGESNGGTKKIYPYLREGDIVKLEADRFDWNRPDPRISFNNNTFVAMGGSAGYGMGNTRVEVEIGYECFKKRGIRDSGKDEADKVYLLATELAYDVVTYQTDKLAAALAKIPGKDIVRFAKAVEIFHPNIEKKICVTKKQSSGSKYGKYASITDNSDGGGGHHSRKGEVAVCGAVATHDYGGVMTAQTFKDFVSATLLGDGSKNWPTSTAIVDDSKKEKGKRGNPEPVTNDNAEAVARDLVNELTPEEKTIVAGLLAKTIEGAEVVEIKSISTTSFIVSVCSDITSEDFVAVPYACLGLGGNMIEVVEGQSTFKPAYKLKVGLSYQLSQKVNAFADVFYHRVLGNGEYSDLPVRHLIRDRTPEGRSKNAATANFSIKYTGAELGIQLRF